MDDVPGGAVDVRDADVDVLEDVLVDDDEI